MGRNLIDIAKEINYRVYKEFAFTVNVGIAHNKLLAKMASDFEKPNKVHTLFENEIKTKMWPLPCSDLFMLGKKTVPKLLNMQIKTIGDIANTDEKILIKNFGKHGKLMWEYANGIDNSEVNSKFELPKSIGNSVTLPRDLYNLDDINPVLIALCEKVAYRLRKYNLVANIVNVQLRTKDFVDYSHQSKLNFATSDTKEIINLAKEILKNMYKGEPIRLVGVKVNNLEEEDKMQLSLFANDDRQSKLDKVVDEITKKYGKGTITRAGKLNVDFESKKDSE